MIPKGVLRPHWPDVSHELNPFELLSSFVLRHFPSGIWDLALYCVMETGVEAAVLSRNRLDLRVKTRAATNAKSL